ncbi:hypothetical protein [Thalassospira sp.]|uniref:hypothetical protein n=1 Tax=Thalassospira sp. TaxID=1912094 RepID=UPI00273272DB|nr:hypothetical protein [Thalassospira sp.]MDP2696824.1 hypothetical protein [Thalassospira sp.]
MAADTGERTILYPDEPADIPGWGITALPAMILGGAPQSCLFVSDLSISTPQDDKPATDNSSADTATTDTQAVSGETATFTLAVNTPCAPDGPLMARRVTWTLTAPIVYFRTQQSTKGTTRTPVVRTELMIKGVSCPVDLGLMTLAEIEQPLLLGLDALDGRFLIQPDRPKSAPPVAVPSATPPVQPATATPAPPPAPLPNPTPPPKTVPEETPIPTTPTPSTGDDVPTPQIPDTAATTTADDPAIPTPVSTPDTSTNSAPAPPPAPATFPASDNPSPTG